MIRKARRRESPILNSESASMIFPSKQCGCLEGRLWDDRAERIPLQSYALNLSLLVSAKDNTERVGLKLNAENERLETLS